MKKILISLMACMALISFALQRCACAAESPPFMAITIQTEQPPILQQAPRESEIAAYAKYAPSLQTLAIDPLAMSVSATRETDRTMRVLRADLRRDPSRAYVPENSRRAESNLANHRLKERQTPFRQRSHAVLLA